MTPIPEGTLTLLFADIEGSTPLLRRLGDAWPPMLERVRELLQAAVGAHRGLVVDCQGDALFAAFRSAGEAVAAAADGQRALAAEDWPADTVVRVRMGLHAGEPQATGDGGYVGIDVVRAARLCSAGHGGQVLLSETTRLLSGAETRPLGMVTLRGMEAAEPVHQLVAPGLATRFPELRPHAASAQLDSLGASRHDLDERIRAASEALEARISERVATMIERSFRRPGSDHER
jgi:class 3 adenylate cyclase